MGSPVRAIPFALVTSYIGGEQTSGEGCSNGRPMTLTESGRFRFLRRGWSSYAAPKGALALEAFGIAKAIP